MTTLFGILGLIGCGLYEKHHYSKEQVYKRQRKKEQEEHEDLVRRKRAEGIFINLSTGVDQNGKKWWGESRWKD